jgi:hypothetical protein
LTVILCILSFFTHIFFILIHPYSFTTIIHKIHQVHPRLSFFSQLIPAMAHRPTITKHNMIANLEKTQRNIDFHGIIDFLTGTTINYSLLVNPKIIGPWIQEFWATARAEIEDGEDIILATVVGRAIRVTEATIREVLLFDDEGGSVLFAKQEVWDALRNIWYEGPLNRITFQKAMVSPHWKYLIHVLLHCLSPKSTAWDQFGHAIASVLVGLVTNQPFNFSYIILDGMIAHIKVGSLFLLRLFLFFHI